MNKELIKKGLIYAGFVLLLAVIAYSFTPQVLSGKIVNQSDIAAWQDTMFPMTSLYFDPLQQVLYL